MIRDNPLFFLKNRVLSLIFIFMILFFWMLVAFILQTQVLPILGIKGDLLLFITVYTGFLYGWTRGMGTGFIAGLMQDLFSFGQLGLSSVGLVTCGMLAGYCRRTLLLRYWFMRVGLVFMFTILNLIIYLGIARLFSQDVYIILKADWLMVPIGNTIIGGIIFWVVDRYG